PIGELDRGGMRVGPDGEERELLRLSSRDLGEPTTSVSGIDDEQPREAVEVLLALGIPDVVALALDDDRDPAAVLHDGLAREVHPEVVLGLLLKVEIALRLRDGLFGGGHRVPQL